MFNFDVAGKFANNNLTNDVLSGITVALALVQATGMTVGLANQGLAFDTSVTFYVIAITSLVTGAVFMMWLGEQITERGIGPLLILLTRPSAWVLSCYFGTVLLANRVRANDERDSYFIKHQGVLELFNHVGDRGGRGQ